MLPRDVRHPERKHSHVCRWVHAHARHPPPHGVGATAVLFELFGGTIGCCWTKGELDCGMLILLCCCNLLLLLLRRCDPSTLSVLLSRLATSCAHLHTKTTAAVRSPMSADFFLMAYPEEGQNVESSASRSKKPIGKAARICSPARNVRAQPGDVEELRLVGQLLQEVQVFLAEGLEADVAISQVVQDKPFAIKRARTESWHAVRASRKHSAVSAVAGRAEGRE